MCNRHATTCRAAFNLQQAVFSLGGAGVRGCREGGLYSLVSGCRSGATPRLFQGRGQSGTLSQAEESESNHPCLA